LLDIAPRLLLSFMLVVSLWSGTMAAPFTGVIMNKPACCHATPMAGQAESQGACGCAQDSPCRMQVNPHLRVFPALIRSNMDQTPLVHLPIWSSAGGFIKPAHDDIYETIILLKPPGRLFILHANLLI
jgi:hypothetical protein